MKKFFGLILAIVLAFSFVGCSENVGGSKNIEENKTVITTFPTEITDVFGVNYKDAIEILEADGFKVKAIGVSVEDLSKKLVFGFKSVEKGTVVKIEEYIVDDSGYFYKNYDTVYSDEERVMLSDDENIVIYYAKEDYNRDSK